MGDVAYTVKVKVTNDSATMRRAWLPGADQPVRLGFHPEVARLYKIPDDSYESAASTYDFLVMAVGGCLTGVFGGGLAARGIDTAHGKLTSEVTGEVEWDERVLVVKRVHTHYRLESPDADPEIVDRVHDKHAGKCSMARSVAGAIEVTTSYELVATS